MNMYDTPQPLDKYLDIPLECTCGRTHYASIKAVCIAADALSSLPEYVKRFGYTHPYIVCDAITYDIAAARCETLLEQAKIPYTTHVIRHLGFDEATLGELIVHMPDAADVVIAVGTGSITDIIRYMTHKLKLPCFTVATAAPMDGFAASIGILNVNGLKATLPAHNTDVIIGDTEILQNAPYRMSVAGFGDLIGKITCLNDWELARIVNNEHFCAPIVTLVRQCVSDIFEKSAALKDKDPQILGDIMRGLVLSGTAISLYGDSRPASGAEHHMSHYWETIMDQRHQRGSMHGEQVAVGTVLTLMLAEELLRAPIDFAAARRHAAAYDPEAWNAEIRRAYGPAAEEIILLEQTAQKNQPEHVLSRIDSMERHWPDITAQLSTLPSAQSLYKTLRFVNCPAVPKDIGIDRQTLKDTFLYCKEVRPRYTLLQMLYDLNVLDSLSDKVMSRLDTME